MKQFLVALIFAVGGFSQAAVLNEQKGEVKFLAIGRPSALKVSGVGSGPKGDIVIKKSGDEFLLSGEAQFDLNSLKTGIDMRDRHMKEKYLEVARFQEATLKIENAKVGGQGEFKVPALLTLHGVSHPVEVKVAVSPQGDGWQTSSQFKLKLSDYGIEIPKFSGITIADEVEVSAQTQVPKVIEE